MAESIASQTISVSIARPFPDVYAFLSEPENFPAWASGLGSSLERQGDEWIAETPEGKMTVRFTEPNRFGVLDHYVIPASGDKVYIPLRVIAHGPGSEVLLTLLRQPDWTDERAARDAAWVERDLATLKKLLEA